MESARKLQELKPHIDALNKKHKDDKKKLQEEQMKLYKEHGVNPAGGCLPLLVSFPILIALYNLFFQILTNGDLAKVAEEINKVVYFPLLKISSLDLSFFGLSLAHKPSEWQKFGWWFLLIPLFPRGEETLFLKLRLPYFLKKPDRVHMTCYIPADLE